MTGKTHAICGTITMATIALCAGQNLNVQGYEVNTMIALLAAPEGSLLPDIDHQSTALGKKHKIISHVLTHRGITHTLVACAAIYALFLWVAGTGLPFFPSFFFGFFVGYAIHIVADMFNRTGVPLLWPIFPAKLHVWHVVTGTPDEGAFLAFWLLLHVGICYLKLHG